MGFKPGDFFLGIADVFVILAPGAILLVGIAVMVRNPLAPQPETTAASWVVAGLATYIVGHIVSAIGALAEDTCYEKSKWRKSEIESERAEDETLIARVTEILQQLSKPAPDHPFYTHKKEGRKPLTRRAAAVVVTLAGGDAATLLQHRDADRRLFRNATVAFAILFVLASTRTIWASGGPGFDPRGMSAAGVIGWPVLLALVTALVFVRYRDLDRKFSRDAYETLIASNLLGRIK
jgi:hypothetical protein